MSVIMGSGDGKLTLPEQLSWARTIPFNPGSSPGLQKGLGILMLANQGGVKSRARIQSQVDWIPKP